MELDKRKQKCNDKYKINIKNRIEHAVNIKVVIDNPCYFLIICIKKRKENHHPFQLTAAGFNRPQLLTKMIRVGAARFPV